GQVPLGQARDPLEPCAQDGAGGGLPGSGGLVGDVDHVGRAVGSHVRQLVHRSPPGSRMVSITSPSRRLSVPAGTTTRASAVARPPIRWEEAPPTRRTVLEGSSRARRNWVRPGGE